MLKLLFTLAVSGLLVAQIVPAQIMPIQGASSSSVMHQPASEDAIEQNLRTIRASSGLPRLKRVPPSESELELACTAAVTGQEVHDPELGNLHTYVTSDLTSQPEQLKLVALGTSQFPDGGPRKPVYSDNSWPRYSVVVFLDKSSTPNHPVYLVGVARRPSALVEWMTPTSGDNPVKDAKDWKGQVASVCRKAQ